jgi:hypothetical protein
MPSALSGHSVTAGHTTILPSSLKALCASAHCDVPTHCEEYKLANLLYVQVLQPQLVLARRSIAAAPHAVKDEKAELDRIVKEANQGDLWDNELVGNALKVNPDMQLCSQACTR